MANKKAKCDGCGRKYSTHSLAFIGSKLLCYYCQSGYEPPKFKRS